MTPYKDFAHIHSLNGEIKEVTVLAIDTKASLALFTQLNITELNARHALIPLFVCFMQMINTKL